MRVSIEQLEKILDNRIKANSRAVDIVVPALFNGEGLEFVGYNLEEGDSNLEESVQADLISVLDFEFGYHSDDIANIVMESAENTIRLIDHISSASRYIYASGISEPLEELTEGMACSGISIDTLIRRYNDNEYEVIEVVKSRHNLDIIEGREAVIRQCLCTIYESIYYNVVSKEQFMGHIVKFIDSADKRNDGSGIKESKMTVGDRIRSMSDEEMVACGIIDESKFYGKVPEYKWDKYDHTYYGDAKVGCEQYLKLRLDQVDEKLKVKS